MKENIALKENIFRTLMSMLDAKAEEARAAIASAKEARDVDTKSSAGDKHETNRAIMQSELEKNEAQLNHILKQQSELSQINILKNYTTVEFGSLVITDQGNYFIGIGIGKIEMDKKDYYAISLASPVGKLLHGKTTGDKIEFNGRVFLITSIS